MKSDLTRVTVRQFALRAGVNLETIRFYEKQGLLAKPRRRANGYRTYDQNDLARISFIQQGKLIGFTLGEIRELLRLDISDDTRCNDVRAVIRDKLAEVDERLRALRALRAALRKLDAGWPGGKKAKTYWNILAYLNHPAVAETTKDKVKRK